MLESYPRDELFQIDDDTLYHFALAILQLVERPRVRVLARRDRFDRFVSVLVFVPRDRYDSDVRDAIGEHPGAAFKGEVRAFFPFFPEGPLVRVHFIIGRGEAPLSDPGRGALEDAVTVIVRTWTDGLSEALAQRLGTGEGPRAVRALRQGVLGRLSRSLFAAGRGRRHPRDRAAFGGAAARRRLPSPRLGRAQRARAQDLEPQPADPVVGARARARGHGLPRGRRADLPDRARHRAGARLLVSRHAAGARRRRADRSAGREGAARSAVPGGDVGRRRERRLQRAGARRLA